MGLASFVQQVVADMLFHGYFIFFLLFKSKGCYRDLITPAVTEMIFSENDEKDPKSKFHCTGIWFRTSHYTNFAGHTGRNPVMMLLVLVGDLFENAGLGKVHGSTDCPPAGKAIIRKGGVFFRSLNLNRRSSICETRNSAQ